jgi:hypothetical protein
MGVRIGGREREEGGGGDETVVEWWGERCDVTVGMSLCQRLLPAVVAAPSS